MIATLAMGIALASSPCLSAEFEDHTPQDAPRFDPKPAPDGLTLDESTYTEWLWTQGHLAGCLIELRQSLAANEGHEMQLKWVAEKATEAIRTARPGWVRRNGFVLGVTVGAGLVVALVAAIAKTLKVSIQ